MEKTGIRIPLGVKVMVQKIDCWCAALLLSLNISNGLAFIERGVKKPSELALL